MGITGRAAKRWIKIHDEIRGEQTLFLTDSSHTGYGRMYAVAADGSYATSISKGEILQASDYAWEWIDGFLAGSSFPLHEYLGLSPDGDWDVREENVDRWREAIKQFREKGFASSLSPMPTHGFDGPFKESARPWLVVGGIVLQWSASGGWLPEVSQPPVDYLWNFKLDTKCGARKLHDDEERDNFVYCPTCGHVVEIG